MPHHGQQSQLGEHGADLHTDVTRDKFYPVNNDAHAQATLVFEYEHNAVELADGVAGETVVTFKVPDDFVSFTSLELVWSCLVAAGNLRWGFRTRWAAAGEVSSTHSENTGYGETATGGIAFINVQESANPMAMAALALGDYVGVKIQRDGGHANDTIGQAVRILGVTLTYVAEQ